MNLDRTIKIKWSGETTVSGIYSSAKLYKSTSREINKRYLDFKAQLPKSTPRWLTSYFDGMVKVYTDNFYRYDLEFCYWIKDVKYSINRDSDMYYEKHGIKPSELCDMPSGHYWINSDKPYFSKD